MKVHGTEHDLERLASLHHTSYNVYGLGVNFLYRLKSFVALLLTKYSGHGLVAKETLLKMA
jgi:hypothetical protein